MVFNYFWGAAVHYCDAAIGGGRRDEEKARAKERFFSHRDEFGQWDPKNQRPELWNLFNGKKIMGEHFRVFPLSNWTEMDIWQYILQEKVAIPNLYFAHKRKMVDRNGVLLYKSEFLPEKEGEVAEEKLIRFRTIGDMTSTGAEESEAERRPCARCLGAEGRGGQPESQPGRAWAQAVGRKLKEAVWLEAPDVQKTRRDQFDDYFDDVDSFYDSDDYADSGMAIAQHNT